LSQAGQWEVVRIYFNRLHLTRRRAGFWRWMTRPPAALSLAEEALSEGITFAVVTLGAAGFVRGAKHVESMGEVESEALPSCLELVGPTGRIRSFLDSRKAFLADAIVLRMEGKVLVRSADEESAQ
jgi:hypothetical protein